MGLMTKLFGTYSERELKSIYPIVDRIEALEEEYRALSDKELQAKLWAFTDAVLSTETGIRQMEKDDSSVNHAYDLQGRKVETPARGQMYINNGEVVKF